MLRSGFSSVFRRHVGNNFNTTTAKSARSAVGNGTISASCSFSLRNISSDILQTQKHKIMLLRQQQNFSPYAVTGPYGTNMILRAFSSSSKEDGGSDKKQPSSGDGDGDKSGSEGEGTKEIVLTPGEKVVVASRLTMWAGIFAFAAACAYYILKELIPTKMSPNSAFDSAFKIVKNNSEVKRRYGEALKAYGKDHGGHREGRRNFVENTQYTDQHDGSKRTRVRFNIEGQFGNAFVFAEVSSNMKSGEFVYVLVQDKSNGRVHTIVDNRAALTAQRLAGGNKESAAVMSQLLSGGKKE